MTAGNDNPAHSSVLTDSDQKPTVSFDYSDIDRSLPGPPSTSSGEEFAFPVPSLSVAHAATSGGTHIDSF